MASLPVHTETENINKNEKLSIPTSSIDMIPSAHTMQTVHISTDGFSIPTAIPMLVSHRNGMAFTTPSHSNGF